jgi:hypothetical protein
MGHDIDIPKPIYIETCGKITSRGEVRSFDPEMHSVIEALYPSPTTDIQGHVRELHYSGGAQHSREVVNLCRRLLGGPEPDVTLIYVHRGHQRQFKTPLLQLLLPSLAPGIRVHGLRVEQAKIPLDVVLFGMASLGERDRCLIIKDNAIRFGKEDVLAEVEIPYLVLSRATGPWAIENVRLLDEDSVFDASMLDFLDDFSTEHYHCGESLSLASRTTNNRLGIIDIVAN